MPPSAQRPPGGRDIVVCSDGTGKSLDGRATNVVGLVGCLSLDDARRQVVVYDRGIGSGSAGGEAFRSAHRDALASGALRLLEPRTRARPLGERAERAAGLLFGHGLRQNVGEMYCELAALHEGPGDRVLLFGFSRGAFTVRALAGLLHRCGLPGPGEDAEARFGRAWRLFAPMRPDAAAIAALRAGGRACPVHLMGVWDTVKSYGGLRPALLPHLRHNPIVVHVRHALALDERRAWFKPTTWGRLDLDRAGALTRVPPEDARAIEVQDVLEVWFAGCHSDVGGGVPGDTPGIALRWMLAEAAAVTPGLRLNAAGRALLGHDDPTGAPAVQESWTRAWGRAEAIPRQEIDNGGAWPARRWHVGSDGARSPADTPRDGGRVYVHRTAARTRRLPFAVTTVETKRQVRGARSAG
ncbi:MAG TPA: DUF2235 domain-containing protein [Miltoncostaeaceae bacterium]|nr:DUF2235 domain-containing protein [Miltoncostaeaceae bacterium]